MNIKVNGRAFQKIKELMDIDIDATDPGELSDRTAALLSPDESKIILERKEKVNKATDEWLSNQLSQLKNITRDLTFLEEASIELLESEINNRKRENTIRGMFDEASPEQLAHLKKVVVIIVVFTIIVFASYIIF